MFENNEGLLITADAAKFLGISRSSLKNLRRAGKLKPDKYGKNNSIFYSKAQLKKFQNKVSQEIKLLDDSQMLELANTRNNAETYLAHSALPSQHYNEITKLGDKLSKAEPEEYFKTAFNKAETIFIFARLDYENDDGVKISKKLDRVDDLILNAIYSFSRAGFEHFTARNILQHVFGNVSDHFQGESVSIIEEHLEKLMWARLTLTHKDGMGNDKALTIRGQQYFPSMLRENLLDVTMLELKSKASGKRMIVYRLNKKSALFKYAESLNQITSWSVKYMAVPCRRTIQNAVIINYLLTKIALIKK